MLLLIKLNIFLKREHYPILGLNFSHTALLSNSSTASYNRNEYENLAKVLTVTCNISLRCLALENKHK